MKQFIGCDAHKKYSVFVAVNERGEASQEVRLGHDREQYRRYLKQLPAGSHIALEASGHYYWMVDEMEAAGHHPRLTHPLSFDRSDTPGGSAWPSQYPRKRETY